MPFLTEDEAKQKWCHRLPMVIPTDAPDTHNRQQAALHMTGGRCIASGCMAWRFETIASMKRRNGLGKGQMVPAQEYFGGSGYCGLAGRPE